MFSFITTIYTATPFRLFTADAKYGVSATLQSSGKMFLKDITQATDFFFDSSSKQIISFDNRGVAMDYNNDLNLLVMFTNQRGNKNQIFTVSAISENVFQIKTENGKCLTYTDVNSPLTFTPCADSASQKFIRKITEIDIKITTLDGEGLVLTGPNRNKMRLGRSSEASQMRYNSKIPHLTVENNKFAVDNRGPGAEPYATAYEVIAGNKNQHIRLEKIVGSGRQDYHIIDDLNRCLTQYGHNRDLMFETCTGNNNQKFLVNPTNEQSYF